MMGIFGNSMEFNTIIIPVKVSFADNLHPVNIFYLFLKGEFFSEGEGRRTSLRILLIRNILWVICCGDLNSLPYAKPSPR